MIKSTLIWYNCLYFRYILCTLTKEKDLLVKYVWIKDFRKKHYLYMQQNKILRSTNELFLILFEVCKFIMKPWFMYVSNHIKCQAKINQTGLSCFPDSLFPFPFTSNWNQVKWYTPLTPARARQKQISEVQGHPLFHSEVKVAWESWDPVSTQINKYFEKRNCTF